MTSSLLSVRNVKAETATLDWLERIPPMTVDTILITGTTLGSLEFNLSEVKFTSNNLTKLLQVTPFGELEIRSDFVIDEIFNSLIEDNLTYEVPYIVGESGEIYELGVDYFQLNDPKIKLEVSKILELV